MFDREDTSTRNTFWARHWKGIAAVVASFSLLIGGALFVVDRVQTGYEALTAVEDYEGAGGEEVKVTIPSGSSVAQIGGVLIDEGVVKSEDAWDKATKKNTNSTLIQAGRYRLKTELPAAAALDMLLDADNLAIQRVTVPEGLRLKEQIDVLAKNTNISKKDYEKALKNPKKLGLPKAAKGNAEGMLFPSTYDLDDDASATDVLKMMVSQYKKVAKDLKYKSKAKKLGYSPYEMLTVASIIEAEVRRDKDRPKVARVLYNRLDDGMKLQLDTTVMYANNKRVGATTSDKERDKKSPYNTYVSEGLPPGPITAPGKKSMEAAANPAKGDWIYFVAVNLESGKTNFADDASGHAKNVKKFQKWCQDNKGKC